KWRQRMLRIALIALPLLLLGSNSPEASAPAQNRCGLLELRPCVAVLFAFRNDGKQEDTGFVKCLEMLAKDRDWLNEFNDARQNRRFGATSGHAHAICSLQCEYVLVVLDFEDCVLPGTDAQILFLLNCDGDYLDHMVCGISNRLTSWIN